MTEKQRNMVRDLCIEALRGEQIIIPCGTYKHYKGGVYKVIAMATHTETLEDVVIYTDDKEKLWVRPASMWNDVVDTPNGKMKRYTKLEGDKKMSDIYVKLDEVIEEIRSSFDAESAVTAVKTLDTVSIPEHLVNRGVFKMEPSKEVKNER